MTIHETAVRADLYAEELEALVRLYTKLYEGAPDDAHADDLSDMTAELAKVAKTAGYLARQLALKANGSIR